MIFDIHSLKILTGGLPDDSRIVTFEGHSELNIEGDIHVSGDYSTAPWARRIPHIRHDWNQLARQNDSGALFNR